MKPRPADGESQAGWSSPDRAAEVHDEVDEDAHPFRAAEAERYDALDVLGAGGMGTVYAALDRRLGREVALKVVTVSDDDDAAAERLAREAQITARLEHPGIVPVHDAGVGANGRLFYTMRLVRGRSLAVALAGASDAPARMGLLRHLLAAVHAVAFAHARGVVHRDLKPANIMVGEHGETVVVDWGLAEDRTVPTPRRAAGTPAYMAPAQAAGEPAAPVDDVWSLGAILYELLRGRPLSDATTTAAARDGARPDLLALRRAHTPVELIAIVDKALAPALDARFADAGALAVDLEAYLDGRRVGAHVYTPLELIARLARLWRVPLLVAGVGVIVVAIVFALTWRRVLGERGRAVAAEHTTREALVAAQASLASALEGHAASAFDEGARPEAELLAAGALAIGESATARGVLAAGGARPVTGTFLAVPGCVQMLAARDGLVVCLDGTALSLRAQADGAARWTRALPTTEAILFAGGRVGVLGATNGAALLAAADGATELDAPEIVAAKELAVSPDGRWFAGVTAAHDLTVIEVDARRATAMGRVCTPADVEAFALGPDSLIVSCSDARLLMRPLASPGPDVWHQLARATKGTTTLAVHPDGRRAVLGGVDGTVTAIDLATGAQGPPRTVATGPTRRLAFVGEHLLVTPARGGAMLWELQSGVEVLRLPRGDQRRYVAGTEEIVGLGAGMWRWRLPAAMPPWRLVAPAGLGSAAVSLDGTLLAVGRGDGHVTVWDRRDGRVVADLALSQRVIKRLAFAADGKLLVAAVAGPEGVQRIDVATWVATPVPDAVASRRVAMLGDGTLVAAPYADGLDVWRDGVHTRVLPDLRVRDAYVAPGAEVVWILTEDDRLIRWRPGGHEVIGSAPGAQGVTASRDGSRVATWHLRGARGLEVSTGLTWWMPSTSGEVAGVTLTADGRWLAIGTVTGVTEVHDAGGALIARLRGHRERTADAALSGDGELVTTSWDGTALTWDLRGLATPPDEVAAATLASWGEGIVAPLAPR